MMIRNAKWIKMPKNIGMVSPIFKKEWKIEERPQCAELWVTALGVYEAKLNGRRISDYVLAPGWTVYKKRLQYQVYDITSFLEESNELTVTVGKGWFSSDMPGWIDNKEKHERMNRPNGILGGIYLKYANGRESFIETDNSWLCGESQIRFSDIYNGEHYDATFQTSEWMCAEEFDWSKEILIPQEGKKIREMECVSAKEIIHTPAGETVIDFGQEVTGYVEISVDAKAGDRIHILHGEVLDQKGNFYNENYRDAKAELRYICRDGKQVWHPVHTFFGFRYIKLAEFPGEVCLEQFQAIVVYSDIKKTAAVSCGNELLNQFFSNVFWGQKGNFLDVPTDCPQRDERLGWTGDAQIFIKAASYNYDVEQFFRKWLRDLSAEQREDGGVPNVIPDYICDYWSSSAWGDAVTICPWQIYLSYGEKQVLEDQFESMKKWVDYITNTTTTPYLWTGSVHFGDWVALDAPNGGMKGASRDDLIAAAFYAYSTGILVRAGKILGKDMKEYQELYENIVAAFQEEYPDYLTQTEHIVALQFQLAKDPQKTADELAKMIERDGIQLKTGFVGTPYILHALSDHGYAELAYSLLLRTQYPSWLFQVKQGATTVWEHMDGIKENGEFWSIKMNSFNHYAYGSVIDWVYEKAAGIRVCEEAPGFEKVRIEPVTDPRLGWLHVSLQTRHGRISSKWNYVGKAVRYEIEADMPAEIKIDGVTTKVGPGCYTFWSRT